MELQQAPVYKHLWCLEGLKTDGLRGNTSHSNSYPKLYKAGRKSPTAMNIHELKYLINTLDECFQKVY
jgi:hypothetical protein